MLLHLIILRFVVGIWWADFYKVLRKKFCRDIYKLQTWFISEIWHEWGHNSGLLLFKLSRNYLNFSSEYKMWAKWIFQFKIECPSKNNLRCDKMIASGIPELRIFSIYNINVEIPLQANLKPFVRMENSLNKSWSFLRSIKFSPFCHGGVI